MNKKQIDSHIFKGMQMDLADSKHPNEYLKYAYNIRITARDDGSLMSITNDKGMTIVNQVNGIYLGHCLIRQYLVVFLINGSNSTIIRYDLSKNPIENLQLYSGQLNFNVKYPIECVGSYENDDVIKVYWTDGLNQPRVINIMKSPDSYNDKSFDFCREVELNDEIHVTKSVSSLGNFPSGVIQYAFTYYDRYAQESNIFNTTPLYYISYNDRGASPEEKVNVSFDITISNYDISWDYIRVYSILRTSINGTPTVKRVIDIPIDSNSTQIRFTDNNTSGDYIDPTELLYKGGESITASTICSKDNTLFLGNISLNKGSLTKKINSLPTKPYTIGIDYRNIYIKSNSSTSASNYFNQLTAYDSLSFNNLVPCGYFKGGNTYRIGLQFQYKDGSWSNPVHVRDYTVPTSTTPSMEYVPSYSYYKVTLPVISVLVGNSAINLALNEGYKRIRPVMAIPDYGTRNILAQGILNPTISHGSTVTSDPDKYQASWFFRPKSPVGSGTLVSSPGTSGGYIGAAGFNDIKSFMENGTNIRRLEMYGIQDVLFAVHYGPYTFNSPDIDFNDYIKSLNMSGLSLRKRGEATYTGCLSAIDIQTDSPTIDADGKGTIHREVTSKSSAGIISGLYYDDNLVDDLTNNTFGSYNKFDYCARWMVFLWHKSGSLNNDIDRSNFSGTRSAVLKKKVVSNLRQAYTYFFEIGDNVNGTFVYIDSNEAESTKVGSSIYSANVNTAFNFSTTPYIFAQTNTSPQALQSNNWCYFSYQKPSDKTSNNKLFRRTGSSEWTESSIEVGDKIKDLAKASGIVRMKYKSTPHIVCDIESEINTTQLTDAMPIVELWRPIKSGNELYGDITSNTWIPCGNSINLSTNSMDITYDYGDTYYQRWDCLKTYPYTKDDENQVVEIGSFMLESYVNIDGRYDRNRGLIDNTNISPINFNLFNEVYSQKDNFFNYRILPSDIYNDVNDLTKFSNQITWSLQKTNGADIDEWTRISLASVYDLNGNHGSVNKLCVYKNDIYCFQDKAISNILFNSRVQIPVSDGLPIEISNNYKVDSARYITESVGCKNKFTISVTPSGIYFIDNISNHLYQIGENIMDVSMTKNMTSWFNNKSIKRTLYDTKNNDLYIFASASDYNKELCFSDILSEFVSEMDIYNNVAFIESYGDNVFAGRDNGGLFFLNTMFTGEYQPWIIEFVSNGNAQGTAGMDKVFTNLEYRMDIYDSDDILLQDNSFNSIQVWNEYQNTGLVNMSYIKDKPSILKKKFRVWRIDIPRSIINKRDRIRNTWCHVKLWSTAYNKSILHDISMIYYV